MIPEAPAKAGAEGTQVTAKPVAKFHMRWLVSVSYTHLTLPTIYSV